MSFRLVPKSVTLKRRSGCYFRYFSEIVSIRGALRIKVVEDIPKLSAQKYSSKRYSF